MTEKPKKTKFFQRAMQMRSTASDEALSHPYLEPALVAECRRVYEKYDPVPGKGLSVPSIGIILNDLGIKRTENEVKDFVYSMMQHSTGRADKQSTGGENDTETYVDFRLFLEVLQMNIGNEVEEVELQQTWRSLDTDGDGVLSSDEFMAALKSVVGMPHMTPAEVMEALAQADFDSDGKVSFEDFVRIMDSNWVKKKM